MLSKKLQETAGNSADAKLYVDDVFSTYVYTGNGSTQTINNGIDLAGKGGLVWIKPRNGVIEHQLFDTVRGAGHRLQTDTTNPEYVPSDNNLLTAFNSNGFSLRESAFVNSTSYNYASWTFRKAAKFFDVVTYTGNGVSTNIVNHNLGVTPGFIIVKCTSAVGSRWVCVAKDNSGNYVYLVLNSTLPSDASTVISNIATTTTFNPGYMGIYFDGYANLNGEQYVAYLFAHDTAADGIIQCGTYTGTGAAVDVTLGFEPQLVMVKRINGLQDWGLMDTMRDYQSQFLRPNASLAEDNGNNSGTPTATGFTANGNWVQNTGIYFYMAIRRPNKPPTTGTQVYAADFASANLTSDALIQIFHTGESSWSPSFASRLTGRLAMSTSSSSAESDAGYTWDSMSGLSSGTANNRIYNFFKRAPGFFDVVCYTGTGVARTLTHNLTVLPKLVILKKRNGIQDWWVWHRDGEQFNGSAMKLNATDRYGSYGWNVWGNGAAGLPVMTDLTFSIGDDLNTASANYISYLFATLAGISKVGSYTGNGSSQNIECGFAAGARFILIKRTDAAGDWYVWDTARGIVSANDPHSSLNTTAPEVTTDDSVDPYSAGFAVNQVAATNINVASATYIFLAIA